MKKFKKIISLFIALAMLLSFSTVYGHSVNLDPNSLISFPVRIYNGSGTIYISSSQTDYSLYYQAVEMSDSNYDQIVSLKDTGKNELDTIETALDTLEAEYRSLQTIYNEKVAAYQALQSAGASETELQSALSEVTEAETNYLNKGTEYNTKLDEYNAKVIEINNGIKALTPMYVEADWTQTTDDKFNVDLSQFSGDKSFVIWAKLVSSDGTISYDEVIYTFNGTKVDEVEVESISLNKGSISIEKGNSYTLKVTIIPSDATDKSIIWSSDNENVATVQDGIVTGISSGTATITASTTDGKHTATCQVTVTEKGILQIPSNGTGTSTPADDTVAPSILPQTGTLSFVIVFAIAVLAVISVIMYKKSNELNFK